ncbi:hypothetical protein [Flavobacterium filum]|uniref:hypothetical protein n=1 Tax=Flavobacterium filum TaxID=370974 RepID=UPI0023F379FE|nr:hypothetical protein [Flavobacterium filum]
MKKTLKVICEKTGKESIVEYELVNIDLAGGISTQKVGNWHCSERQNNNISVDCTCQKELRKLN